MNRKFLMTAVVVALALSPAAGMDVAKAHGGGGGLAGGGTGHAAGFGGRGLEGRGFLDNHGDFSDEVGLYYAGFSRPYGFGYDFGYDFSQPYTAQRNAVLSKTVWYFCEPTKTYFPYVISCSAPWETVPAVSPQ
jgi:opacity protein-like surface antigen